MANPAHRAGHRGRPVAVQLAASFLLGAWASLLAAALAGLFATLWFVIPMAHRHHHHHRPTKLEPAPPSTD